MEQQKAVVMNIKREGEDREYRTWKVKAIEETECWMS